MWPGQQNPDGEQNPSQNPQNAQNPYLQPGYQQQGQGAPDPHAPWNAPTQPVGPSVPPAHGGGDTGGGGGGRKSDRSRLIALVAAGAVVVACGVTALFTLGGDKDDEARPEPTKSRTSPTASASDDSNSRADGGSLKPTVKGWKVVTNPSQGIAFEVPADWELETPGYAITGGEAGDEDSILIGMRAPAFLQRQWCMDDTNKDGDTDKTALARTGSRGRGNSKAKTVDEMARQDSRTWTYVAYTQPDKKSITTTPAQSYTTKAGLKGKVATSTSEGVRTTKHGKCDSDGKATVFAFTNPEGDFASWAFVGAKGVKAEVPDATVRKILSTVRLYDTEDK
ncbi:hypothetical protein [Streptomyces sp. NPDC059009]|uniref:hypothetical protein n=1 Tax=Streptomyces sp. NPDC059009 TaxID=3346694 RepID=UPI0036CED97B